MLNFLVCYTIYSEEAEEPVNEDVKYQLKDSDTEETERSAGKREQTVSKKKLTAKDFQYLVNTTHYDEEDGGDVYKVMEVVDEVFPKYGKITVAYRSHTDAT